MATTKRDTPTPGEVGNGTLSNGSRALREWARRKEAEDIARRRADKERPIAPKAHR